MTQSTGQIEPQTLYSLEEFKQVSGLGNWALRQARRSGLKMLKIGNRKFVKGQTFMEYLDSQNNSTTDNAPKA